LEKLYYNSPNSVSQFSAFIDSYPASELTLKIVKLVKHMVGLTEQANGQLQVVCQHNTRQKMQTHPCPSGTGTNDPCIQAPQGLNQEPLFMQTY
jgi:hypothetical protein